MQESRVKFGRNGGSAPQNSIEALARLAVRQRLWQWWALARTRGDRTCHRCCWGRGHRSPGSRGLCPQRAARSGALSGLGLTGGDRGRIQEHFLLSQQGRVFAKAVGGGRGGGNVSVFFLEVMVRERMSQTPP